MTYAEAILDLLTLLCGERPTDLIPENLTEEKGLRALTDEQSMALHDFLADKARLSWLTGIGLSEVLDPLVQETINNDARDFYKRDCQLPNGLDPMTLEDARALLKRRGKGLKKVDPEFAQRLKEADATLKELAIRDARKK